LSLADDDGCAGAVERDDAGSEADPSVLLSTTRPDEGVPPTSSDSPAGCVGFGALVCLWASSFAAIDAACAASASCGRGRGSGTGSVVATSVAAVAGAGVLSVGGTDDAGPGGAAVAAVDDATPFVGRGWPKPRTMLSLICAGALGAAMPRVG